MIWVKNKKTSSYPEIKVAISIKLLCIKLLFNFIEITFRHGCCPINLLHIFRAPFPKNTSGGLLLYYVSMIFKQKF